MSEQETSNLSVSNKAEKADVKALLETANSASERVAGLHVAFMAVCVYVLVIIFGTTDLDLLMGKGVRLPVVNVDVPIVGFYAFAPYLVVLAHFNLLLQLQLLSRKLFAFDAAVPREEGIGGLRDRLHIFPYTYYLVGRPSPLVRPLVGLMVSITLVLLPLATLLALQLQFLAYQSESVTWWQRIAIWLDVLVISILWPVILHPKDDWRDYWRGIIAAHIPRRRVWAVPVLILLGLILFSFSAGSPYGPSEEVIAFFFVGLVLLLLSLPLLIVLSGWKSTQRNRRNYLLWLFLLASGSLYAIVELNLQKLLFPAIPWLVVPVAVFWHPQAPRGSLALLLALYVGALLPMALHVESEGIERMVLRAQSMPQGSTLMSILIQNKRRLDLQEEILLAKPLRPETLSLIRSGSWQEALKQIEPINLQVRNLRHANMINVVLIGADLRQAQVQGALIGWSQLEGANLRQAQLQGTELKYAHLQGSDLRQAQLQGANLEFAQLQGADLREAHLQGANLGLAQLQGANLYKAQLQGANLGGADLRGAVLGELQGADLSGARLDGAVFAANSFYGTRMNQTDTPLVTVSGTHWEPLSSDTYTDLTNELRSVISDTIWLEHALAGLEAASRPAAQRLVFDSCLAYTVTPVMCKRHFDRNNTKNEKEFIAELHVFLTRLACESSDTARGIIRQLPERKGTGSSREGLDFRLKRLLEDEHCRGLKNLSAEEKKNLREMPKATALP